MEQPLGQPPSTLPPSDPQNSQPSRVVATDDALPTSHKNTKEVALKIAGLIGFLVLATLFAVGMYAFQHGKLLTSSSSSLKPSSGKATTANPSKAAPSSSLVAPPPAQPPSAPPPAPSPAPPPDLSLTNQDNGRTITMPVGTTFTVSLAQLPAVSGYHWGLLALSYATKQLGGVVKPGGGYYPLVMNPDGSIVDRHVIRASGDFTIEYNDHANCSPGCAAQNPPVATWTLHINVP